MPLWTGDILARCDGWRKLEKGEILIKMEEEPFYKLSTPLKTWNFLGSL
jgi:hypothetical protein